jgi:hypothetical protein
MHQFSQLRTYLSVFGLVLVLLPLQGLAQQNSAVPGTSPQATSAERDGQHDFDFEIGTWKTQLSRLQRPLADSNTWVKY